MLYHVSTLYTHEFFISAILQREMNTVTVLVPTVMMATVKKPVSTVSHRMESQPHGVSTSWGFRLIYG